MLLVLGTMFVALLDDASDLVKAEKMKSECSEKVQAAMSAYAKCQACAGRTTNGQYILTQSENVTCFQVKIESRERIG